MDRFMVETPLVERLPMSMHLASLSLTQFRKVLRGVPLAAVLLLMVGCFSHIPVEPAAVPPGSEVVVHLNLAGSERLSPEAGYTVRSLSGYLQSVDSDALALSVWSGRRYQGMAVDNIRRNYTLNLSEVARVEQRQLNRQRSALVGAGILVGLIFAIDLTWGGSSGGPGPPAPPGEPAPAIVPR
jgi:hypothetical protein